jgi:hypothetical protein
LDIEGIFIIGYFDDVICEEIYLFTVGLWWANLSLCGKEHTKKHNH